MHPIRLIHLFFNNEQSLSPLTYQDDIINITSELPLIVSEIHYYKHPATKCSQAALKAEFEESGDSTKSILNYFTQANNIYPKRATDVSPATRCNPR